MTRFFDIVICTAPFFMGALVGHFYGFAEGLIVALGFAFAAMAYLYLAAGEDEWDE